MMVFLYVSVTLHTRLCTTVTCSDLCSFEHHQLRPQQTTHNLHQFVTKLHMCHLDWLRKILQSQFLHTYVFP